MDVVLLHTRQLARIDSAALAALNTFATKGYTVRCQWEADGPEVPFDPANPYPTCTTCGATMDMVTAGSGGSYGPLPMHLEDLIPEQVAESDLWVQLRLAFLREWAVFQGLADRPLDLAEVYRAAFDRWVPELEPHRYWSGAVQDGLTSVALLAERGMVPDVGTFWGDVSARVGEEVLAANPEMKDSSEYLTVPHTVFMGLQELAVLMSLTSRKADLEGLAVMAMCYVVVSGEK